MDRKNDWKLVADARTGLLRQWLPLSTAILLLVILQTVLRRYEELGTTLLAWAWLMSGVLPGTLMLYFSSWLNKYPEKLIAPSAYRALKGIAIAHLVLMLLTLLLLPFGVRTMATKTYLLLSFLWAVPGSLLVAGGLFLLFFKKESRLRPNAAILQNVAKKEADKARESGSVARLQCLDLVAGNELDKALAHLRNCFENSPGHTDQVVMLQSRHKKVTDQFGMGVLAETEAQLEINKITEALLNLSKFVQN